MNKQTKRKIKNYSKSAGKYTLNSIKFLEKNALEATEIATKKNGKASSIAKNPNVRGIVAGATTIGACVAFTAPMISLTGMSYLYNNILLGRKYTAINALRGTLESTDRLIDGVLDITLGDTKTLAKGVENVSHKGKEVLDK